MQIIKNFNNIINTNNNQNTNIMNKLSCSEPINKKKFPSYTENLDKYNYLNSINMHSYNKGSKESKSKIDFMIDNINKLNQNAHNANFIVQSNLEASSNVFLKNTSNNYEEETLTNINLLNKNNKAKINKYGNNLNNKKNTQKSNINNNYNKFNLLASDLDKNTEKETDYNNINKNLISNFKNNIFIEDKFNSLISFNIQKKDSVNLHDKSISNKNTNQICTNMYSYNSNLNNSFKNSSNSTNKYFKNNKQKPKILEVNNFKYYSSAKEIVSSNIDFSIGNYNPLSNSINLNKKSSKIYVNNINSKNFNYCKKNKKILNTTDNKIQDNLLYSNTNKINKSNNLVTNINKFNNCRKTIKKISFINNNDKYNENSKFLMSNSSILNNNYNNILKYNSNNVINDKNYNFTQNLKLITHKNETCQTNLNIKSCKYRACSFIENINNESKGNLLLKTNNTKKYFNDYFNKTSNLFTSCTINHNIHTKKKTYINNKNSGNIKLNNDVLKFSKNIKDILSPKLSKEINNIKDNNNTILDNNVSLYYNIKNNKMNICKDAILNAINCKNSNTNNSKFNNNINIINVDCLKNNEINSTLSINKKKIDYKIIKSQSNIKKVYNRSVVNTVKLSNYKTTDHYLKFYKQKNLKNVSICKKPININSNLWNKYDYNILINNCYNKLNNSEYLPINTNRQINNYSQIKTKTKVIKKNTNIKNPINNFKKKFVYENIKVLNKSNYKDKENIDKKITISNYKNQTFNIFDSASKNSNYIKNYTYTYDHCRLMDKSNYRNTSDIDSKNFESNLLTKFCNLSNRIKQLSILPNAKNNYCRTVSPKTKKYNIHNSEKKIYALFNTNISKSLITNNKYIKNISNSFEINTNINRHIIDTNKNINTESKEILRKFNNTMNNNYNKLRLLNNYTFEISNKPKFNLEKKYFNNKSKSVNISELSFDHIMDNYKNNKKYVKREYKNLNNCSILDINNIDLNKINNSYYKKRNSNFKNLINNYKSFSNCHKDLKNITNKAYYTSNKTFNINYDHKSKCISKSKKTVNPFKNLNNKLNLKRYKNNKTIEVNKDNDNKYFDSQIISEVSKSNIYNDNIIMYHKLDETLNDYDKNHYSNKLKITVISNCNNNFVGLSGISLYSDYKNIKDSLVSIKNCIIYDKDNIVIDVKTDNVTTLPKTYEFEYNTSNIQVLDVFSIDSLNSISNISIHINKVYNNLNNTKFYLIYKGNIPQSLLYRINLLNKNNQNDINSLCTSNIDLNNITNSFDKKITKQSFEKNNYIHKNKIFEFDNYYKLNMYNSLLNRSSDSDDYNKLKKSLDKTLLSSKKSKFINNKADYIKNCSNKKNYININILQNWGNPLFVGFNNLKLYDNNFDELIIIKIYTSNLCNNNNNLKDNYIDITDIVRKNTSHSLDTEFKLENKNLNILIHYKLNNLSKSYLKFIRFKNFNNYDCLDKGIKLVKIEYINELILNSNNKSYITTKTLFLRKGVGDTKHDFSQFIDIYFNINKLTNEEILPFENILFPEYIEQDFSPPYLPTGLKLEFLLISNYGDKDYIGLNQIELYDQLGKNITKKMYNEKEVLNEQLFEKYNINCFDLFKIISIPNGICNLNSMEKDKKRIDNIINYNKYIKNSYQKRSKIVSGETTWLCPYVKKKSSIIQNNINYNRIIILFNKPITISYIKIYNYSKSPCRGVKEIKILMDDLCIYGGYVKKAEENLFQNEDNCCSIIFSGDDNIISEKVKSLVGNNTKKKTYQEKITYENLGSINTSIIDAEKDKYKNKKNNKNNKDENNYKKANTNFFKEHIFINQDYYEMIKKYLDKNILNDNITLKE